MIALDRAKAERLRSGLVIPAHPLALTEGRRLDERRQRALTRYYLAAGAGGLAVGVHTTQFAIHDPQIGLLQPVLELAADVARDEQGGAAVCIAGVVGPTEQAMKEAVLAAELGYDLILPSLGALANESEPALLAHCRELAQILPLFGFYLQPAVGGRPLSYEFWRSFAELPNVAAIKIAPFNRYATLDVVRAVVDAGRTGDIALYTGNDDHILLDMLVRHRFGAEAPAHRIVGGLLGQWAVWTQSAVKLLERVSAVLDHEDPCVDAELLTLGAQLTDANGAIFDASRNYAGSIPGIHEILRRQGLLAGRWCLDPMEDLSPGQLDDIDRVYRAYPHLADDLFVAEHLGQWLS